MRYEEHIAAEAHLRALEIAQDIADEAAKKATEKAKKENSIEMVRNFLSVGTPIEFIIKATGWSESQILQLKTQ